VTQDDIPTFELPEPPHGKKSVFVAAGKKLGEWHGTRISEAIKAAVLAGSNSEAYCDELNRDVAKSILATVTDLRIRGWPQHLPDAFEKSALAAYKKFLGRASVIEQLKGR
jgi:hypothetical protein